MPEEFTEPFLLLFGFGLGIGLAGLITCILAILGEVTLKKLGVLK